MSAPDYFCELLDFAMPWDRGQAALLVAYFDASERTSGTFCVAGLAFGADRAKKATKRWQNLWGNTRCHMTDLNSGHGAFEDWEPEQRAQRLKDSVPIINKYASYGVAVSCALDEIKALAPQTAAPRTLEYLDGFRRAYAVCCHVAMSLLGGIASADTDIAYFFESGDQYQPEAQRFIALVAGQLIGKAAYRHHSHTVLDKGSARLFETSDILAWEWAKHIERQQQGKPNMRGSLKAILGEEIGLDRDFSSPSRRMRHLTGEPLKRYFNNIERSILSDPLLKVV